MSKNLNGVARVTLTSGEHFDAEIVGILRGEYEFLQFGSAHEPVRTRRVAVLSYDDGRVLVGPDFREATTKELTGFVDHYFNYGVFHPDVLRVMVDTDYSVPADPEDEAWLEAELGEEEADLALDPEQEEGTDDEQDDVEAPAEEEGSDGESGEESEEPAEQPVSEPDEASDGAEDTEDEVEESDEAESEVSEDEDEE